MQIFSICSLRIPVRMPSSVIKSISRTLQRHSGLCAFHRTVLLCIVLFLTSASLAQVSDSTGSGTHEFNANKPPKSDSVTRNMCRRLSKQEVEVQPPEKDRNRCKPGKTFIATCGGQCPGYTSIKARPPFQVTQCQCCTANQYDREPRRRRVIFNCGGRNETLSVYLYRPTKCGCIDC